MRILIVEDEVKIARALKKGLEQETFAVDITHDGDAGEAFALSEPYDLVILDRMLPGSLDGIGIVMSMREKKLMVPVLLLTAKDKIEERVEGLEAGADDYLVKPFAFEELLARVRALLRRPVRQDATVLTCGELSLNPSTYDVTRDGKPVYLTTKEFALLEFLMRNAGQVVSKTQIMQHVWDFDADILPNTVEVYMGYLRAKLEKPFGGRPVISTRRGFGYVLGDGS
jgi:DNA-binding response OmpR family regulator